MTAIPLDPSLLKIKPAATPVEASAATLKPAPANNSGWIQTLLIIAAIVLGFAWLSTRDGGSVDPIPPTPKNTIAIAEKATRDYSSLLGDAMESLASSIDSGKIGNAEQLQANSQAFTKAARVKAFAVIDQLDTDSIPAGQWTDEQRATVSAYLRDKATGHRKASK